MAMPKELKELYEKAVGEKENILAELAPLREEEERLRELVKPINAELEETLNKIAGIEKERGLSDVSRIIATLAPKAIRFKVEGG